MRTDVSFIEIERKDNGGANIELVKSNGVKATIWLLEKEVDFVIDPDRYIPATFRDISYFYTFYSDSIIHTYSSMRHKSDWTFFVLPVNETIIPGLKAIRRGARRWRCPIERMEELRNRFWPRYKIHWGEDALERAIPHIDLLREHLRGIFLIASNYSDGDHVYIDIRLDGWQPNDPPSFYWVISKWLPNESRFVCVINGGIVWHGDEYSTHT